MFKKIWKWFVGLFKKKLVPQVSKPKLKVFRKEKQENIRRKIQIAKGYLTKSNGLREEEKCHTAKKQKLETA